MKPVLYTVADMSCLFCKIIEGSIPSKAVYQDEQSYAFLDIDPKAPVHVLVIPRKHIASTGSGGSGRLGAPGALALGRGRNCAQERALRTATAS